MRQGRDIGEAEAHESRNLQRTEFRDVAERAAAHVAIVVSIRKRADTNTVQHDPDDPGEGFHAILDVPCARRKNKL
jgi:hypothetical protein